MYVCVWQRNMQDNDKICLQSTREQKRRWGYQPGIFISLYTTVQAFRQAHHRWTLLLGLALFGGPDPNHLDRS